MVSPSPGGLSTFSGITGIIGLGFRGFERIEKWVMTASELRDEATQVISSVQGVLIDRYNFNLLSTFHMNTTPGMRDWRIVKTTVIYAWVNQLIVLDPPSLDNARARSLMNVIE